VFSGVENKIALIGENHGKEWIDTAMRQSSDIFSISGLKEQIHGAELPNLHDGQIWMAYYTRCKPSDLDG